VTRAEEFEGLRSLLFAIAYRILGSVTEAEDAVQETWLRFEATPTQPSSTKAYLSAVVTRISIDVLRSARVRREAYVGPWLPDPIVVADDDAVDPLERVTLDDSVRMALLVVLERLSPAERLAFVLHDVFQYSFDTVADITGRSPAACRQLASRARRHIEAEAGPARFDVDPGALRRVAERFIDAANTGDVEALLEVLDPEVAGWTDSGGLVPAPRQTLVGRDRVTHNLLGWLQGDGVTLRLASVNGRPGALAMQDDNVLAVLALATHDGRIVRIHGLANPEKLARVRESLNGRR
jgi:RNA polymerase sigma-70 factor (ECF subfamily)